MRLDNIVFGSLLVILLSPGKGAVIRVPMDQPTIQSAIDATTDGDTVVVDPAIYVESINFKGKRIVVGSLFLSSGDTSYIPNTVIDGDSLGTVAMFENGEDSTAVLTGFTITNGVGSPSRGGGITVTNFSSPTLDHLIVRGNRSRYNGGGILVWNTGVITLRKIVIEANEADFGAGIDCHYTTHLRLFNVTIRGNSAVRRGGGILCWASTLSFEDVTITQNDAGEQGGGVFSGSSNLNLNNVDISRNTSGEEGGGIFFQASPSSMWSNVTLAYNTAGVYGGGLYFHFSTGPTFDVERRSNIYLNHATFTGDDIYAFYSATIQVSVDTFTVLRPTAYHVYPDTGFIYDILNAKVVQSETDLYVSPAGDDSNTGENPTTPLRTVSSALQRILADSSHRRVIHLAEGTYSASATGESFPINRLSYVTLSGHSSETTVLNAETSTRVLDFDHATEAAAEKMTVKWGLATYGGGVYTWRSALSLRNLIVRENFATHGGGIFLDESIATLSNVLVTGNQASGNGGGVVCLLTRPTLINVTITGNTSDGRGGGVDYYWNFVPILVNSIVWNNSPNEIYFTAPSSSDSLVVAYSDIEGGRDGVVTSGGGLVSWLDGNISDDPMFENPPQNDFFLQSSSPGIDAGTDFFVWAGDTVLDLPPDDYYGNAPDMGAFESTFSTDIVGGQLGPESFALHQNYPNPFNPTTMIEFSVPQLSLVSLSAYDILGRQVDSILNRYLDAGTYKVQWTARSIASGTYFIKLRAGDFTETRKVTVLR